MKNIVAITLIISQLTIVSAQAYIAKEDGSQIIWKGYGEIGGFTQTGTIQLKDALIEYDGSVLTGEILIDMNTISHEDKQLEKHLKAKDFFNVKKFPISRFTIHSHDQNKVNGILEMKGITNEVSFNTKISEKEDNLIVQGEGTIDRTNFDIKYNSSSYFQDLGNYAIKNEFDLEFEIVFRKE